MPNPDERHAAGPLPPPCGGLLATGLVNTWLRPELLILTRFWVKIGLVALVLVVVCLGLAFR